MSASREKMRRKDDRGNGVSAKNQGQDIGQRLFKNIVTVLCVAAVLAVICIALLGQGLPQQYMNAAVADGVPVSVAEYDYHYYNSLQNFYSTFGSYFSMFGIDATKPLSEQAYSETESWHDYLVSATLANIREVVRMSELAKSEGVTLNDEDVATINETLEAVKNSAASSGLSEKKFIRNVFGRAVTLDNLKTSMERELLANRYEKINSDKVAFTADEVDAYYAENKNNYDGVTYRSYGFTKGLSDEEYDAKEAEGIDLEAEVETPLGTMTAEDKYAYDSAVELSEKVTDADSFHELAKEYAGEDELASFDDDNHTLTVNGAYADDALNNWLFDPARVTGDITVINNDTQFVTVMFIERVVDDYATATIRQIYIAPTATSSTGEYTEAEWEQARIKAQAALDQFVNNGGTEEAFTALVKDNSMDTNTKNSGGLYKERGKGTVGSDEIDEWLFDSERKSGDYSMFRTEYGYHVIYFAGLGRTANIVEAETTMRNEKYTEIRDAKLADVPEPSKDWLGMNFTTKA